MGTFRSLEPPLHSLDPADWWMYCDLLQEQGAAPAVWRKARRIGDSLKAGVGLTLVLSCSADGLEGHPLRVGKEWFIPAHLTSACSYRTFQWWRPSWIRQGFERYPARIHLEMRKDPEATLAFGTGTPFAHRYGEVARLKERHGIRVVTRFFDTHARRRQPAAWL